ncbi:hypothetical protein DFH09DRAFT_576416 [Mycena vulgaris]|nr:hypothetical protein DFH09DRAFT_576416 [Mycena vulgaris]
MCRGVSPCSCAMATQRRARRRSSSVVIRYVLSEANRFFAVGYVVSGAARFRDSEAFCRLDFDAMADGIPLGRGGCAMRIVIGQGGRISGCGFCFSGPARRESLDSDLRLAGPYVECTRSCVLDLHDHALAGSYTISMRMHGARDLNQEMRRNKKASQESKCLYHQRNKKASIYSTYLYFSPCALLPSTPLLLCTLFTPSYAHPTIPPPFRLPLPAMHTLLTHSLGSPDVVFVHPALRGAGESFDSDLRLAGHMPSVLDPHDDALAGSGSGSYNNLRVDV